MSQSPGSLLKAVLYPLIQRFSNFFPFSKKGPLGQSTEGNMDQEASQQAILSLPNREPMHGQYPQLPCDMLSL